MAALDPLVVMGLVLLGLAAGVGIAAIGPGGVLATIGLFVLTDLSPAQVAGTALVTHVGTGTLATLAYARSGHLTANPTRRTALTLAAAALVGTPLGVVINKSMSGDAFGDVLAVFTAVTAALVWYRDRRTSRTGELPVAAGGPRIAAVGLAVATGSAVVGVGGPMLSVPLLVALGHRLLPALAAAQVQSVVIAGVGTVSYLATGDVDWSLALLIGVPQMVGVLVGWRIARSVPTRALTYSLVVVLLALAPYLALRG